MGKTRGKITSISGNTGMLKYKNDAGERFEIPFDQLYPTELGLTEGTVVTFDLITAGEKPMGVSVNSIDKGEVIDLDYKTGKGVIFEAESGRKYNFVQKYLKETGIDKGSEVKYTIISVKDTLYATCLTLPE